MTLKDLIETIDEMLPDEKLLEISSGMEGGALGRFLNDLLQKDFDERSTSLEQLEHVATKLERAMEGLIVAQARMAIERDYLLARARTVEGN